MEHKAGNQEEDLIEEVQEEADTVELVPMESPAETNAPLAPNAPKKRQFFVHVISPKKSKTVAFAPVTEPPSLKTICAQTINNLLRTSKLTLSNWVKYISSKPDELQHILFSDLIIRSQVENPNLDKIHRLELLELCEKICSELKKIKQDNCYASFLDAMLENLTQMSTRSFRLQCIAQILQENTSLGERVLKRLTDKNGYHLYPYKIDEARYYLIAHEQIKDFTYEKVGMTQVVNDKISVTSSAITQQLNAKIKSAKKNIEFE